MGSYLKLPIIKKPRKKKKVKNEDLTFHYIIETTGIVPVRQHYIREKIIVNGELIRNYIICDFYLEWRGKRIIIEFNGGQHYDARIYKTAWRQKQSDEDFRKQVMRDDWLRIYCKKNKIILIEIDGRSLKREKILAYLLTIFSKL